MVAGWQEYVEVPHSRSLNLGGADFTIEGRIAPLRWFGNAVIMGKWHGGNEYRLSIRDG